MLHIKKLYKSRVFIYLIIFLLSILFLFFSYYFAKYINNKNNVEDLTILEQSIKAIENEYPEYKNFEKQNSFAGTDIDIVKDNSDYYFVYKVLGSGVPIGKATCFRVDRNLRVYMVGEYPDLLDSYNAYKNINPKNCAGIK